MLADAVRLYRKHVVAGLVDAASCGDEVVNCTSEGVRQIERLRSQPRGWRDGDLAGLARLKSDRR